MLQGLCETTTKVLHEKEGFFRGVLNDEEFALVDLGLISMDDEYAVRIGDNSRSFKLLQDAKQLAQALIQNDKINFSTFLNLLDTDNLAEFKDELKAVEKELEGREQQMQQAQQQHDKEIQEMMNKEQEETRKQRLDEIRLKGDYDLEKAKISAMSWSEDHDINDNDVPDILEFEKLQRAAEESDANFDLQRSKLDNDTRKLDQKDKEINNNETNNAFNRKAKMEDLRLKDKKLAIDKIKKKTVS